MRQLAGRQFRDGGIALVDLDPSAVLLETRRIATADSPYAVIPEDQVLLVDTTLGAVEVLLEATSGVAGRVLTIKDTAGNVSPTKTLTLTPDGSETIDGVGARILTTAFASLQVVAVPGGWVIIREM